MIEKLLSAIDESNKVESIHAVEKDCKVLVLNFEEMSATIIQGKSSSLIIINGEMTETKYDFYDKVIELLESAQIKLN